VSGFLMTFFGYQIQTRAEEALAPIGKIDLIFAAATAHHRLLWIHPFLDANGRVARLVSYAVLRESLDTGGLWSISRGLAKNEQIYKQHLAAYTPDYIGSFGLWRSQIFIYPRASFLEFLCNPRTPVGARPFPS
jgi:Fic family protein